MAWEEKQAAFQTELMVAKDAIWGLTARIINLETEVKDLKSIIVSGKGLESTIPRSPKRKRRSRYSNSSLKFASEQFRRESEDGDEFSNGSSVSIKLERRASPSNDPSDEDRNAYLNESEAESSFAQDPDYLQGERGNYRSLSSTRKKLKNKSSSNKNNKVQKQELEDKLDKDNNFNNQDLLNVNKIEPTRVRTRKSYELKQKMEIINLIKAGKSQRDIADETGMSRGSVGHIWRDREKLEAHYSMGRGNVKKNRKSKYAEIDQELYKWYCDNRDSSMDGGMLKAHALQLAINLGFPTFTASNGWFDGWKSRFNLRFRKEKQSAAAPVQASVASVALTSDMVNS